MLLSGGSRSRSGDSGHSAAGISDSESFRLLFPVLCRDSLGEVVNCPASVTFLLLLRDHWERGTRRSASRFIVCRIEIGTFAAGSR